MRGGEGERETERHSLEKEQERLPGAADSQWQGVSTTKGLPLKSVKKPYFVGQKIEKKCLCLKMYVKVKHFVASESLRANTNVDI